MADRTQLGELQWHIMRVLWEQGGATVSQVHQVLGPPRNLSASTIGTMLQKMEKKGVVRHRQEGRRYVYVPTVSEAEVRRSMVGELTRRLFGGDPLQLLGHLVREEELDGSDLEHLRDQIARAETKPEVPRATKKPKRQGGSA